MRMAIVVLALHLGFILWVIFGARLTRGRTVLRGLHIGSLVWGLLVEIVPWMVMGELVTVVVPTVVGSATSGISPVAEPTGTESVAVAL